MPDGQAFSNSFEFKKLLADHDLLAEAFIEHLATYALRRVMTVDDNHIVKKFIEKPVLNELMNIGYYYLPLKHNSYMENKKDLLSYIDFLIKNNRLKCYKHEGIHITINTIAELSEAEDNIEKIL